MWNISYSAKKLNFKKQLIVICTAHHISSQVVYWRYMDPHWFRWYLSHVQCQAVTWTNADLQSTVIQGTNSWVNCISFSQDISVRHLYFTKISHAKFAYIVQAPICKNHLIFGRQIIITSQECILLLVYMLGFGGMIKSIGNKIHPWFSTHVAYCQHLWPPW